MQINESKLKKILENKDERYQFIYKSIQKEIDNQSYSKLINIAKDLTKQNNN